MTFAVNAGTTELTGTEVATLSQVGGDLQYSRPPNPLTSLDSNLSGPLSPMAVSVFDRNQWLVVARSPTAFAYLWRSCSASGCTTSLPSFFGSIPPGYLVDWDRLSFVHLNGITWGCGQNFADSSDTFCMTPSGGFGDFVGGRIATHVRSGPTSIDLAWVPNTGNTVVDSTMPTVRVARITGCAPGEPSSFSTFSLTNAFGTQTNSIGLALPEFSPVPGPTPALLWLEAPGRLRYVQ